MTILRPVSTRDLTPSERHFLDVIQQLGFGRLECLRIERGRLILDPWPTTAREVKFCARGNQRDSDAEDFTLKQQVVELFEYVRSTEIGQIRKLEIKNGLPFSMEVEHQPGVAEGSRRG
jgi:hypothetical protein